MPVSLREQGNIPLQGSLPAHSLLVQGNLPQVGPLKDQFAAQSATVQLDIDV